jgi:hypothetical protein
MTAQYDIEQPPEQFRPRSILVDHRATAEQFGDYRIAVPAKSISFKKADYSQSEPDDIAIEFQELSKRWRRETGHQSSLTLKFMHPSYQRIMAMGKPALPLILRNLEQKPGHWFYALRFIAGQSALGVADGSETIEEASQAWLAWGRRKGHI